MELTVALLAYGEAANLDKLLPAVIDTAEGISEDFEIIVIDGMESRDNTEEVCLKHGVRYRNQEEPYYGGAYRTAIRYAKGKYFLIHDADGSHDPRDVERLYRKIQEGYDVVVGSRYMEGSHTQDKPVSIVMSKCLNLAYRLCLGLKVKDVSDSFRIYRTELLKALRLECDNYDIAEEILFKLKLNEPGIRMAEVPIVFHKRMEGESKRHLVKFIISYIKSLARFIIMRIKAAFGK